MLVGRSKKKTGHKKGKASWGQLSKWWKRTANTHTKKRTGGKNSHQLVNCQRQAARRRHSSTVWRKTRAFTKRKRLFRGTRWRAHYHIKICPTLSIKHSFFIFIFFPADKYMKNEENLVMLSTLSLLLCVCVCVCQLARSSIMNLRGCVIWIESDGPCNQESVS